MKILISHNQYVYSIVGALVQIDTDIAADPEGLAEEIESLLTDADREIDYGL